MQSTEPVRYSREGSILGLLQAVCTGGSQAPPIMEAVIKQLVQLASGPHSTGSPKNGVKTCSCIVHLVLLQVLCFVYVY